MARDRQVCLSGFAGETLVFVIHDVALPSWCVPESYQSPKGWSICRSVDAQLRRTLPLRPLFSMLLLEKVLQND